MAYVESDKDKDLDPSGQPVATGPAAGGATLDAGVAGGSAGNAPKEATASGSSGAGGAAPFVGIKQYLDANQPQSEKLANNVGGYVSGLGQNVRDTVGSQSNAFNQNVDQNTVNLNQGLIDEAKTNAQGVAGDAGKLADFQKQRDATYKGPTDLQGSDFYKPINDALTKAQQAGADSQTEQGQKGLINQYQQQQTGHIGGAGTTNFDQALLQSGGGREALAKARDSQADLPGVVDTAQQASLAKAKQASDTTAATKQAVQSNFGAGGAYGQDPLQQQLTARANTQIAQAKAQQDQIKTKLQQGAELNDGELKSVGLSRDDYNKIRTQQQEAFTGNTGGFGFAGAQSGQGTQQDLSTYLHPVDPSTQINAQNVASPEEIARYQALNQLMGTNNSFLANPALANTANTSTVGNVDAQAAKDYLTQVLSGIKPAAQQTRAPGPYDQGGNGSSPNDPIMNAVNAAPQVLGAASAIGLSDKRAKKDIKPFSASEFLDSLSRRA